MLDLTISIVNYKSSDLVRNCINSILKYTNEISYEIIVVDNCSNDNIKNVVDEFENIKLIVNNKNLGFSAANNLALEQCHAKYFLLLNPDTLLLNNALKILFNFMENHPKCAVSCPQLFFPNGTEQKSYSDFRTPLSRIKWDIYPMLNRLGIFYFFKYFNKSKSNKLEKKVNNELKPRKEKFKIVERPRGACFFVRKSHIDLVGPMDERFFMYCEEVDWAFRFFKYGFKNYICFKAKVEHIWGGTSKNYDSILKLVQIQSEYKYFRKHYGFIGFSIIVIGNLFSSILATILIFFNLFNKDEKNILLSKVKFHIKCSYIYFLKIRI